MDNAVNTQELTITLDTSATQDLNVKIDANYIASGPLVNIASNTNGGVTSYTVTVLAYIPSETLNDVNPSAGLVQSVPIKGNKIQMNYYGASTVTVTDASGTPQTRTCRDFRIEFNANEGAKKFDLYHIQFTYSIPEGTEPVDVIYVREQNDDPETDRGTVTGPADTDE